MAQSQWTCLKQLVQNDQEVLLNGSFFTKISSKKNRNSSIDKSNRLMGEELITFLPPIVMNTPMTHVGVPMPQI
jgi:hypothetical protein